MKRHFPFHRLRHAGNLALTAGFIAATNLAAEVQSIETTRLRFALSPDTGQYELTDKQADVSWKSNPYQSRFGDVALNVGGQTRRVNLDACQIEKTGDGLVATFAPLAEKPEAKLRVRVRPLAGNRTLEFVYTADPALAVENIRLLDDALWTTDADQGYLVVPVREGLLIPADNNLNFNHRFDTYAYEGCHMTMLGAVNRRLRSPPSAKSMTAIMEGGIKYRFEHLQDRLLNPPIDHVGNSKASLTSSGFG